jgi:hypothetical protein
VMDLDNGREIIDDAPLEKTHGRCVRCAIILVGTFVLWTYAGSGTEASCVKH